jgi:thiamine-monophosphate kinase
VGEWQLVQRLRKILDAVSEESLVLDDAAPLAIPTHSSTIWMTTDASPLPCFVEIIGLGSTYHSGWLAIAKSISDLAAVGAEPIALTLALELPAEWPVDRFDEFFLGAAECAKAHGTRIVGGNIKESRRPHVVSTAIGVSGPSGWLLRGKAPLGSVVYVLDAQEVGAFWAGVATAGPSFASGSSSNLAAVEYVRDRAVKPRAQVQARAALRRFPPSFCMDSSDGILGCVTELAKISEASVVLNLSAHEMDERVQAIAAACQADPRVWALGWGSYHLVCASSAIDVTSTFAALRDIGVRPYVIGKIVEGQPEVLLALDGRTAPLANSALLRGEQFDKDSFGNAGYEGYAKLMRASRLEDWAAN